MKAEEKATAEYHSYLRFEKEIVLFFSSEGEMRTWHGSRILTGCLLHSERSVACFWCISRARPHVGDALLIQIDVAIRGMLKQRLLGTPVGFQVEQLCGLHRSDRVSVGEKAKNGKLLNFHRFPDFQLILV